MRTDFHRLTVARVDELTDDSAAVTFQVPPELRDAFAFSPGQSLTVQRGDRAPLVLDLCAGRTGTANRRA